ncbi:aminotransferase class I/II-fold pyridoxal phosphate-dependent enzyme [Paenibacillus alkaliterrae]|uniref:pyridoxal phosphate-dependent aminotransferase n=1 Tax=Paenibacillus alkaliterrae TaxID=320909 RepID=UPI001F3E527C|nr:threonine-phosphate decarboxylase [Paenibacillus alkaliterrae]MCF2937117.1 aminotransferase class I/II-fold pyridoxal phosphate-dependent enzyme [Paenibacillus alkaliterrae]
MLERYGHGGDLRTAEEAFGIAADRFVDFSSNMNPLGPPPSVKPALHAYADLIGQYPDPAVRGLRRKLSELHNIDEHSIVIGNGAAELIDLVVRALQPKLTALAIPCFDEYRDAVRKIGGAIYEIKLSADNHFLLDGDSEKLFEIAETGVLFMLGSPNNPTGQLVEPGLIMKLLQEGAYVVVDEAFMDFVPEESRYSLIQEAARHERLFVIRSMTKFYSIPGIRLGYIVGKPRSLSGLRRLQVPWSVNSLAQLIGEAVLGEADFAGRTLAWLLKERPWLIAELEAVGCAVCPSAANYLLVRIPPELGMSASMLQLAVGKLGVLIRDASRFPGLNHSYIRVAVKQREQNELLVKALKQCFENTGNRGD